MKTTRVRVALAADVMLGRGIDQALESSVDPELHEPVVQDARSYIDLAEERHGRIGAPLGPREPWGDLLDTLNRLEPDTFVVNLETSVTEGGRPWPGKGIHYRMHPDNLAVLTAAGVECCTLANNHLLDYDRTGLLDTLRSLTGTGISAAGAGVNRSEAQRTAEVGSVRVAAAGCSDSGIPLSWAATEHESGVFYLDRLNERAVEELTRALSPTGIDMDGDQAAGNHPADGEEIPARDWSDTRRPTILSLHWGANWGHEIPGAHRRFAARLAERGSVDALFGHSSHHAKAIEVHRGVPVIYGAGDLINDYEGIAGHERYRPDLRLLYILDFLDGRARRITAVPFVMYRFRLHHADRADAVLVAEILGAAPASPEFTVTRVGLIEADLPEGR